MLACIRSAGIMSAGRHVDMYTLIYINGYLPSCRPACFYIYLYGYTNGMADIMTAGGKTFIHLPIYVATCLSIDLLQIMNIHTELIIYIGLYIH